MGVKKKEAGNNKKIAEPLHFLIPRNQKNRKIIKYSQLVLGETVFFYKFSHLSFCNYTTNVK